MMRLEGRGFGAADVSKGYRVFGHAHRRDGHRVRRHLCGDTPATWGSRRVTMSWGRRDWDEESGAAR
jgi:hypothetical protein